MNILNRRLLPARPAGLALLAATLAFRAHADYQSTVISQAPVGYWRLGETTQPHPPLTTAANLGTLGSLENGTYNGDQSFFRGFPGALASSDTAAQLNIAASDQSVQAPFNSALNPTNFSFEAWLAPATDSPIGSLTCALSCGDFGSPRAGWLLYQSTTGWALRMYNHNGLTFSLNLAITTSIVPGTYYHVAVTFDGTTARAYVDGVLTASGNPTSYVPGTNGVFSIGTRSDDAFFWQGDADEVAFYSSVLSSNDIAAHFSAATTNAAGYSSQILALNPLLYFRLNEAGDPSAANLGTLGSAGNAAYLAPSHPGTAGPTPPPFPGFEAGNKAVSFDGTGGYVSAPPLNLNADTVTITAWVNVTNAQKAGTGLVFCRSDFTVAGLTIDPNHDGLGLGYNWGGDPATTAWSPTPDSGLPALPDSHWAFVALVVQPDQAAIYIANDTNAASFAGATNFATHPVQPFEVATLFGADLGGSPSALFLNGAMDEVAIWDRALGAGEVYSQFASALGGVAPTVFNDPQSPANSLSEGDTLALVVDAGGTPVLSYQWRKGGQPIGGATTSAFVLSNVALTDAGNYDVVITNAFGKATSQPASVAVIPATSPSISRGPVSRVLYPGSVLTLSVVASGGQLTYQWNKDGSALAGATASTYSVASVTTNDAGAYSVTVTNKLGNASAGPVTIAVVVPASGTYEDTLLSDAPEAWWRLDETSAGVLFDSMGRHDGTYTNLTGSPVSLGAPGAILGSSDTSASFDGSQSFGLVPYSPALNSPEFTIECWVKSPGSTVPLCPVSTFKTKFGFFWEMLANGDFQGCDGYGASDGFNNRVATVSGHNQPGQWVHLVGSYGSAGHKLYVNGRWDGNGPYADFSRNNSDPFRIGAGFGGNDGNLFWNGQIDEVSVYTYALSDAQIAAHYAVGKYGTVTAPVFTRQPGSQSLIVGQALSLSPLVEGSLPITYQWLKNGVALAGKTTVGLSISPVAETDAGSYRLQAANSAGTNLSAVAEVTVAPEPIYANVTNGLVLHLKFDGDVQDASGHGNNGTVQGSPSFVAGAVGSGALHYSTKTDTGVSGGTVTEANYVSLGTPADLKFGSTTDFSVAFWVRLPSGYTNGDLPFFDSATNSDNNFGFTFSPTYGPGGGTPGGWQWCLSDNTNTVDVNSPADTIGDGIWHSLVMTFSRTGDGITYLDGTVVDTTSITNVKSFDTAGPIVIGQDPTGLYPEPGSADIDDLGVWRRALTQAEAVDIYYAGKHGNSFDTVSPARPTLSITSQGGVWKITYTGVLQSSATVNGTYTDLNGASSPYQVPTSSGAMQFYRTHN